MSKPPTWHTRAGNWIDDQLSILAPRAAFRRKAARQLYQAMGGSFRASKKTRLNTGWVTRSESADASIYGELATIRDRSRDLNRNDAIASGATDTIVVNTVKNGIIPQAKIKGKALGLSDDQIAAFHAQAENVYEKWSPWASSNGKLDFGEIQALAIRQIIECGEFLAVRRAMPTEGGRPYMLALDVIEPDRLDDLKSAMKSNDRFGIEFDENGAPKNYKILKTHPGEMIAGANYTDYSTIPAKDGAGRPLVFHLYPYKRPGQSRGAPFFAPVIDMFRTLADYIEAELVAARIAACFAVFITTNTDAYTAAVGRAQDSQTGADNKTQRLETVEPGMIEYLSNGQSVNFAAPNKPGNTFDAFVERLLRLIGTSLGLPYELILKDFSKTNYSSARAALLQAYRFFMVWQDFLKKKLCQPVWEILLEEAWLRGELAAPGFQKFRWEYTRAVWVAPGWPWVDPRAEVEANSGAIKMGLKSRAQVCAEQGDDWEEIAEQNAQEKAKYEQLGLPWEGVEAKAKTANQEEGREQKP